VIVIPLAESGAEFNKLFFFLVRSANGFNKLGMSCSFLGHFRPGNKALWADRR
jgi:hypothetical protein